MRAHRELPMIPYQPRRTQSLGIVERAGWAVKIIGITADGDLPDTTEVEAAAGAAQPLLPQPARTSKRPGARRTGLRPVSGNCSPSTTNGERGSRTCWNGPLIPTLPG